MTMTPRQLKTARKKLGMTQQQLGEALELDGKWKSRTVRLWEADGGTVPGPVAVAVRYMLKEKGLK